MGLNNFKYRKGFSLLKIILVLGIGTSLAFIKFQDMIHDQEDIKASATDQEISRGRKWIYQYVKYKKTILRDGFLFII